MNPPRSRRRLAGATVVGASIGILVAGGLVLGRQATRHPASDLHERLHEAVPLDAREQAVLDAKERAFAARRVAIEVQLQHANDRLAEAIATDPRWSPQVEAATRQVERAAGDLQRATLVHIFEMRDGLEPQHRAAYDKVLLETLRRGTR